MTDDPGLSAPAPVRQCSAWWCDAETVQGSIFCRRHHDLLPPELRSEVRATFASAVGYVASIQMRAAFRTLPEDVRERLREEARRL